MNLEEAFDLALPDAIEAEEWYVTLMIRLQLYGGPEEGGWWYSNRRIVKYASFSTKEQARKALARVEAMAKEMTVDALRAHGDHCLAQMEWLDARGREPDDLPGLHGPDEYYVVMSQGLPEEESSRPTYE